jgi:amino acid adenylation domain-containing protein
MNIEEFLQMLRNRRISLWIDGENLHYRAPAGAITPSIRETLKNRKTELIDLLDHQARVYKAQRDHKPLSFAQRRIWFFEQLIPGSPAYNAYCAFWITGTLRVSALAASINEIIRRHSILRSRCMSSGGKPLQVFLPEIQVKLHTIDLSGDASFDRGKKAIDIATKEVRRPFSLMDAPLFRMTLLKLDRQIYVLVLVSHHFVMDGYSFRNVFMEELSKLHEAFASGKPSPLPALAIQFHDYVEIEQRLAETDQLNHHLEYWRHKLEGIPQLMQLPTYQSRPLITTYRGAVQRFSIKNPLSEDIKILSRKLRISLFMIYLAAFQALLYRYINEIKIVVGTTVTHRPSLETEALIGPLANNLILVTDFTGNPTFRDICKQVYEVTTEAYSHQDLPFEKLVEALRPGRNLGHNPLFQFLFMFHENSRGAKFHLKGTKSEWLPIDLGTSRFDLSLELETVKNEVAGSIEYSTDLYSTETIELLIKHFLKLLKSVVGDPSRRASEIDFLTEAEREKMVSKSDTDIFNRGSEVCLHKLFETQASKNPEAIAVVCGQKHWTFHELNQRANALAWHLRILGVGPDKVVGICADRSMSLIVGLMGILKAGGAYLPMDPAYPPQRLSFMMRDSKANILVTQYNTASMLPKHSGAVVYLDHFTQADSTSEIPNPPSDVHANNLAYLIYTSGSTGQPKGVAVEHHSVSVLLNWAKDIWGDKERAGVLASTSICFDLSVFEIFLPLCFSGCVVLVENIFELLSAKKIDACVTLINSTPSVITELIRLDKIPASAKTVNLAGEKLFKELPNKLYKSKNVQNVYNLYGPSEDTVYSTFYRVLPGETRTPPIGRPIPGTGAFILNQNLQPVPFGVVGELCLSGEGLARGYWNRPKLNAEKFIKNPFGRKPGARIYRTGDLVRVLSDGNLEFIGRCDEQIKSHGFRIEPGEIESALRNHPDVSDAAVIARSGEKRDVHLIAYVVSNLEEELIVSELRAFLKRSLPEYMIPSIFLSIDSIPLTPNGKLDRQALPEPDKQRPNIRSDYRMPRNIAEKAITGIWQEVLNLERVGTHDNFFDLGGHSLLLVQVHAKLKEKFKSDLSLIELFKYPTIIDLTKHIMQEHLDSDFYMKVHRRAEKQINALNRRKPFLTKKRRTYE